MAPPGPGVWGRMTPFEGDVRPGHAFAARGPELISLSPSTGAADEFQRSHRRRVERRGRARPGDDRVTVWIALGSAWGCRESARERHVLPSCPVLYPGFARRGSTSSSSQAPGWRRAFPTRRTLSTE